MSASEAELLEDLRPRTFAIVYRMLGSVSEAEDVVQETLLRVHNAIEARRGDHLAARLPPRSRPAWRSTSCARPARDGRPTSASGCPSRSPSGPRTIRREQAEVADSLSLAFLVLLDSLSPEQRARSSCTTSSITTTRGSRRSSAPARRTRGSSPLAPGVTCRTGRPASTPPEQREKLSASFFAAVENGDFDAPRVAARRGRRAAR